MTRPSTLASFPAKYEVEGTLAEERPVAIPYGDGFLTGSLSLVPNAHGVVLIASDAGCSRHSSAWRELSAAFRRSGFATALVDLVKPEEAADPECAAWTRHRVHELAKRISSARSWLVTRPELDGFPVVLFGQRTAAAPVLLSAAARPDRLAAVIVRDGTPIESGIALSSVRAPVLLLVDTAPTCLRQWLCAETEVASQRAIAMLPADAAPEACGRIASTWIHTRLVRREVASAAVVQSRGRAAELAPPRASRSAAARA